MGKGNISTSWALKGETLTWQDMGKVSPHRREASRSSQALSTLSPHAHDRDEGIHVVDETSPRGPTRCTIGLLKNSVEAAAQRNTREPSFAGSKYLDEGE